MIGRMLVEHGLNNPFSGNISWKAGGGFWITRTGIMKNDLKRKDFILCKSRIPRGASVEAPVHGAIYEKTDANAVIHAHPPFAIALSISREFIEPEDEGGRYLVSHIPVLALKNPVGSEESAARVSETLAFNRCALLRGHGIFVKGKNLEDAFRIVCVTESACRIACLKSFLG